jgi:hypothetical protein
MNYILTCLYVNSNKARPYWAKDLIFLISDMEYIGTQAWVNSYFDIKSSCNITIFKVEE